MGTNYYLHSNTCGHCGRSDEPLHICKSHLLFHAPVDFWCDDGEPVYFPSTWRQWKELIARRVRRGGRIVDEYGVEHDEPSFVAAVEGTATEARRRWFDAEVDRRAGATPPGEWLDLDGFHFSASDFS